MVGTCPPTAEWQALLHGGLSPAEQARLEAHLGECPRCQGDLEKLAVGECGVERAVRGCGGTPAPPASALWPALAGLMQQAKTVPAPDKAPTRVPRDTALDFLAPSEDPAAVGRLGNFEVVRLIGQGGMGLVLQALDPCLNRQVAIKVLDPRMANNEVARQRFCREARAAARITHEHVVAVHQVEHEESSDLPFLVMQLVSGESLEQRLTRGWRPGPDEVARVGMQTAAGLAAAHEQGLIHRDIKPANILLEHGTDRVKLTDFGLARATEDVKLTSTGFVAGTPLYMSPEQAHGAAEMDHRSDLFSLGVVLYELATGEVPFGGTTPLAVLKRLTEESHRPARQINPAVPAWLNAVIDRLLEKRPDDRFQSAAEVAGVLAHHLAEQGKLSPLQVPGMPGSTPTCPKTGRAGWWKRWLPVLIAAPVLAVGLALALPPLFRRAAPTADAASVKPLRALDAGTGPIWAIAFAGDTATVAAGLDEGAVKFWDAETGRVLATLNKAHKGPVWSLAFSRDGARFATGSEDRTVKLWDAATRRPIATLEHNAGVRAVEFSPDGTKLVTGARDGALRLWGVPEGKPLLRLAGHEGMIVDVAFSDDGKTIATAGGDKTVKLWDAATGQEQVTLRGHEGGVYGAAFQPGGALVASGSYDKTVRLWDAATGKPAAVLRGHEQDVWGVAFSPDGRRIASGGEDNLVKVWDVETGRAVATLRDHKRTVYAVAFSRDGRLLVTAGRDEQAQVWDATAWQK